MKNGHILLNKHQQEQASSANRHKISKNDLHTGLDENKRRTGSFTYDSAIGYDTTWLRS
jgi:hypothetical protein